jgi:hypothetical protein
VTLFQKNFTRVFTPERREGMGLLETVIIGAQVGLGCLAFVVVVIAGLVGMAWIVVKKLGI